MKQVCTMIFYGTVNQVNFFASLLLV